MVDKFEYPSTHFVPMFPNMVQKLVETTYSILMIERNRFIDGRTYGHLCSTREIENESRIEVGAWRIRVVCARLYRYQEDVEEDEGELESNRNPTHTGYGYLSVPPPPIATDESDAYLSG